MVAVALLLSLVVVLSASVDAVAGCTAGTGGSCQTLDTDCDRDNPGDEWHVCINIDTCTEVPSPGGCPATGHDGQSMVNPIPRPDNVTVELSSTNPNCYSARVRWELSTNISGALKGFQVESHAEEPSDTLLVQCVYLNDPDAREFTFHGLRYNPSSFPSLTVKLWSLPHSSEQDAVTNTQPVPASCRDLPYIPYHCNPPKYNKVQNIHFTTTLVSENPSEMRIHLTWEHPVTPHPFPDPSIYYIQVIDKNKQDPFMYFRVENTLSVTLPPLNASRSYRVTIQPYVQCAGLDIGPEVRNGCGEKEMVLVFYKYTLPSPSTPESVTPKTSNTSISVVSCPDSVLETHDQNHDKCTAANPVASTGVPVGPSPTIRIQETPTQIDSTSSSTISAPETPTQVDSTSSPTISVPETPAVGSTSSSTINAPETPAVGRTSSSTISAPETLTVSSPTINISVPATPEANTVSAMEVIVPVVVAAITIFVIAIILLYVCNKILLEPKEVETIGLSCPFSSSLKQPLPPPSVSLDQLNIVLQTSYPVPAPPLQATSSHDHHSTESFQTPSTQTFPTPSTQTSPTPSTQSSPTPSTQSSPTPSTHSSTQTFQTPSTHPSSQTSPTPSAHISIQTFPTPSSDLPTQTSLTPSTDLPTQTSPTPSTRDPVLLVYSQNSPERDVHVVQQLLVKGLSQYDNIDVTHNSGVQRGSLPVWLAEEFQRAVTVLVVCNQQLYQEWNHQGRDSVVPALKQRINVAVGKPEFSKIAVVLLRASDEQYIPTPYLDDTRTFLVNKDVVKAIAHFVKEVPLYVS